MKHLLAIFSTCSILPIIIFCTGGIHSSIENDILSIIMSYAMFFGAPALFLICLYKSASAEELSTLKSFTKRAGNYGTLVGISVCALFALPFIYYAGDISRVSKFMQLIGMAYLIHFMFMVYAAMSYKLKVLLHSRS
jgi:hypothetical protein